MSALYSDRWIRLAVSILLFAGLGISVLTVRLFVDGKRLYEQANQAAASGAPWRNVVMRYENAAKTYFPGNPYPKRAMWKLSVMAKSAGMRGETKRERYIWEVVRRSAVSQRHFFQPFADFVAQANEHTGVTGGLDGTSIPDSDGLEDPSIAASLLLWAGLMMWIFGSIVLISLKQNHRRVVLFGICLPGLAMWIIAALLA